METLEYFCIGIKEFLGKSVFDLAKIIYSWPKPLLITALEKLSFDSLPGVSSIIVYFLLFIAVDLIEDLIVPDFFTEFLGLLP